jgi:hypothetical protein
MRRVCLKSCIIFVFLLAAAISQNVSAMFSGGYVITGAYGGTSNVLLDSAGKVVFTWSHSKLSDAEGRLNGYSAYLLPNGNLLRSAIVPEGTVVSTMAPRQGILQEIDRDGKIVWRYQLANDTFMLHHDMKPMSNGHILAVTFVAQTAVQVAATGVDTSLMRGMRGANRFLLTEKIIEIDPKAAGGPKIVWEWKIYDHIIRGDSAAAHPELISGTISSSVYYTNQWMHLNSLDYNEKLDMILFSSRVFSELYIIDHGTTTQEAAGHTGGARGKGGDILYRWGKSANYGATGGTTISVLHSTNWIPETYPGGGDIVFFHNNEKGGASQLVEIKPPMDASGVFQKTAGQAFGPAQPAWIFAPTSNFYSMSMSTALRLPNGNTLGHLAYPSSGGGMGTGASIIKEVDANKQVVALCTLNLKGEAVEKANPQSFNPAKIMYYDKNYAGIKALLSGSGIREGNIAAARGLFYKGAIRQMSRKIEFSNIAGCEINLFNMQGKKVFSSRPSIPTFSIESGRIPAGLYCARVSKGGMPVDSRMINVPK